MPVTRLIPIGLPALHARRFLIGRDEDVATLEAFISGTPEGFALLVLDGEAGIGKTSLWEAGIGVADDAGIQVMTAHPSPAESALSFVGLNDLVEKVHASVWAELPLPQRSALEAALARSATDSSVKSGAVAIAFLSAIRALARRQPLLIAIDDYQWLDRSTARVVEFALRRLSTEPVRVIVASRPEFATPWEQRLGPDRVTHHMVKPLPATALYHLIHDHLGVPLGRPTLLRIHETSRGNPFFALELARELAERREYEYQGRPLPLPERLNDLLRTRLGRLPQHTRHLLAAAAALSSPELADLARMDGSPPETVARDLETAERAGIIIVRDVKVEFTHPMLAAAAYATASQRERDQIHATAAAIERDPEEASRHRALSLRMPDEHAALQLAETARRAHVRGATDIAAHFAEQSLRLTPPQDKGVVFRRALIAGELMLAAGNQGRARQLFDMAFDYSQTGVERAEALLHRAQLATPLRKAVALGEQALTETQDSSLRSLIHRLLGGVSYALGEVVGAERHAREAVRLAEQGTDQEALGLALAELAHWTFCAGGGYQEDLFDRAVALNDSASATSPRSHYAKITMDAGFFAKARQQLDGLLREATLQGDLQAVATHHLHLSQLEMWSGNFQRAIDHADESLLLHEYSDQPSAPRHVKGMSLACLGRTELARQEAEMGLTEAENSDNVLLTIYNLHVLGFLEFSLGNLVSAEGRLRRATDLHRPRWNNEFGDAHLVPDQVEVLLALGHVEEAEDLVLWMEEVGAATHRTWTLAAGTRCRGLILAAQGRLDEAEAALHLALDHHQTLPMPFELGRTMLALGTVQRRRKQRAAAAESLRQSHDTFVNLGCPIWARKARAEEARIGVRSEAQRSLTPVQQRIALLASQGRNNREIADLLFISRKTVESNLTQIYRKLGIHSRAQLGGVLTQSGVRAASN